MTRTPPTISLADYESRLPQIAQELTAAARDIGFFYLADHGIPQEEIDAAFATGRKFLDAPLDWKLQEGLKFDPDTYLGYRGVDELASVSGVKLWEWVSVGRWGLGGFDYENQVLKGERWPEELGPEFRDGALAWQRRAHDLGIKVLRALWLGLGRDEKEIYEAIDFDSALASSFIAWNHYPAVPQEEQERLREEHGGKLPPRLHAHADSTVLTILFQREGEVGLEVAPGSEVVNPEIINDLANCWNLVPQAEEWTPVPPKPGCFTVNIGDVLMRWTDGELKSTYHRVRSPLPDDPNPYGPRYSMPYFWLTKLDYTIQGPKKAFPPVTGYEMLSGIGRGYQARVGAEDTSFKDSAYLSEIAELEASASRSGATHNGNGNVSSAGKSKAAGKKSVAVAAQPRPKAALMVTSSAPRLAAPRMLARSALLGASLRTTRAAF